MPRIPVAARGHTAECELAAASQRMWQQLCAREARVRAWLVLHRAPQVESAVYLAEGHVHPASGNRFLRRVLRRALAAALSLGTHLSKEPPGGFPHAQSLFVKLRLACVSTSFMQSAIEWDDRIKRHVLYRSVALGQVSAWISTMGGAHAQLGEDSEVHGSGSVQHTGEAEVYAYKQYRIAHQLGDYTLAARCKLHLGLSALQRRDFRRAEALILQQLHYCTVKAPERKMYSMCTSAYAKLKYTMDLEGLDTIIKHSEYCKVLRFGRF